MCNYVLCFFFFVMENTSLSHALPPTQTLIFPENIRQPIRIKHSTACSVINYNNFTYNHLKEQIVFSLHRLKCVCLCTIGIHPYDYGLLKFIKRLFPQLLIEMRERQ